MGIEQSDVHILHANRKREIVPIRRFANDLVGFIPVYLEFNQNGTQLLLKDGSVQSVIRLVMQTYHDFAHHHYIDVPRLRKDFRETCSKFQYLPLGTAVTNQVFSPVKCRSNLQNRNDGATGYIDPNCIEKVVGHSNQTTDIWLIGGHCVHVIMSKISVERRMNEAKNFLRFLKESQGKN